MKKVRNVGREFQGMSGMGTGNSREKLGTLGGNFEESSGMRESHGKLGMRAGNCRECQEWGHRVPGKAGNGERESWGSIRNVGKEFRRKLGNEGREF